MDRRPELICKALSNCASETETVLIPSGQPGRTEFIEAVNRKIRDECFGVKHVYSLGHAEGFFEV